MYKINAFCIATAVVLQSIQPVFADSSTTNSYPTYQNGILTLPRIDTSTQPGNFQNATFKYNAQGTWDLQNFETSRKTDTIQQVKLVITDSFPIQVFLNIQGQQGCDSLGQINQRLVNNRFEVTLQVANPNIIVDCIGESSLYEKNIPLSVYGLAAGNYEYSVNGGDYVGSFTLAKENSLPLTVAPLCCKK